MCIVTVLGKLDTNPFLLDKGLQESWGLTSWPVHPFWLLQWGAVVSLNRMAHSVLCARHSAPLFLSSNCLVLLLISCQPAGPGGRNPVETEATRGTGGTVVRQNLLMNVGHVGEGENLESRIATEGVWSGSKPGYSGRLRPGATLQQQLRISCLTWFFSSLLGHWIAHRALMAKLLYGQASLSEGPSQRLNPMHFHIQTQRLLS